MPAPIAFSSRAVMTSMPCTRGARLDRLKGHKVYVTLDIDFVDAACAPGVGSAEPFGPNSFEALEALRAVTAVADGIVGCDLVEISPLHDVGQMTTYLGAQL